MQNRETLQTIFLAIANKAGFRRRTMAQNFAYSLIKYLTMVSMQINGQQMVPTF